MARHNLRCAVRAVESLRAEHPVDYQRLVRATALIDSELDDWTRAANLMYVPFDEKLGIHPQDDSFLEREVWDFERTPADKFPLLLFYHPLVIYRRQVIKQADVVFAMFLFGDDFTLEQKRRNFDYYDPLTTGDSSLSACVQGIIAAEIGYAEAAHQHMTYAVLMDLADIGGNVKEGCHIASMGGTWMVMVYGLAGMRDRDGKISFDPRPIGRLKHLRFPLTVRGQTLTVEITGNAVAYTLVKGTCLEITHRGEVIELRPEDPVRRDLA
jgi:alpha,alpha-trehalose phosphorylase